MPSFNIAALKATRFDKIIGMLILIGPCDLFLFDFNAFHLDLRFMRKQVPLQLARVSEAFTTFLTNVWTLALITSCRCQNHSPYACACESSNYLIG